MIFRILVPLAELLGPNRAPGVMALVGRVLWRFVPARKNVENNFSRFGLPQNHARPVIENFGKYLGEFLSHREANEELFADSDLSCIDKQLKDGKGVLLVTPHYGNWEAGAGLLARRFGPINVLFRSTGSNYLDRVMREKRRPNRMLDIDRDLRGFSGALARGEIVATAIEEPRSSGERVRFFGSEIFFPKGLFRIAARSGATVLPVLCRRTREGKIELVVGRPAENIQEVADQFEAWIREDPTQWIMLSRY